MFQCPRCKDTTTVNHLRIIHSVRCTSSVWNNGEVYDYEVADLAWKDSDQAWCSCGWSGTVKDMTVEETEEEEVA